MPISLSRLRRFRLPRDAPWSLVTLFFLFVLPFLPLEPASGLSGEAMGILSIEQAPADTVSAGAPAFDLDAAAVVGTRGWGGDAHVFGGLVLGAHRGDFGAGATLLAGSGNDHRSILLGAGPSASFGKIGAVGVDLRSWIGVGHLSERLLNDRAPGGTEAATRSVTGPMATISLRRPLGPGALTAQAGFLTGRSDGPGFARSPWVHTTRFAVGFGW